jgi:hypothetical protein
VTLTTFGLMTLAAFLGTMTALIAMYVIDRIHTRRNRNYYHP